MPICLLPCDQHACFQWSLSYATCSYVLIIVCAVYIGVARVTLSISGDLIIILLNRLPIR